MATPLSADRLLAVLKAEGLTVHEHAGWKTHSRDAATGKSFGPVYGVLIHHTAGQNDREICFNGRPDLPGPLCHSWLGKTEGVWMLSAGRANHAGLVDGDVIAALRSESSPLPRDDEADYDGNDSLYGLEIENRGNGSDPYPADQYRQAVLWAAALCRAHGWSEKSVAGHKECQPGKIDPSFDMDVFRADVRRQLTKTTTVTPQPTPSKPRVDLSRLVSAARTDPGARQGHVTYMAGTNLTEAALVQVGYLSKTYAGDGSFGSRTVDAYARWQKHLGYTGVDANGIPGMASLTKLGAKTGLFTVIA